MTINAFEKYKTFFSLNNERLAIVNHGSKNILDQIGLIKFIKKAFETINLHLLIAKLGVFGFDIESLKLIKSYLMNRFQRAKVNTSFSNWTKLLLRVPEGSILGSLLYSIYINHLLYLTEKPDN